MFENHAPDTPKWHIFSSRASAAKSATDVVDVAGGLRQASRDIAGGGGKKGADNANRDLDDRRRAGRVRAFLGAGQASVSTAVRATIAAQAGNGVVQAGRHQ